MAVPVRAGAPPSWATRCSTALVPSDRSGAATVVSAGVQKSEPKMLSKPTTLRSRGTTTPTRASRHVTGRPDAER